MVYSVSIQITISLNSTRIFFRAGIPVFPDTITITQCALISLSEIKHIIIRIDSQQISHIYCSTEEFNSVIGTFQHINVLDFRPVTHTVQSQPVVLNISRITCTGIEDIHISQRTGIVGSVTTAVFVSIVNLRIGCISTLCSRTGNRSFTIKDNSSPVTGFLCRFPRSKCDRL